MQIKKANYGISGYPNSHFFINESGLTTATLTQMGKFTQGEVIEITAPVWQLCDSRHENPIANMWVILFIIRRLKTVLIKIPNIREAEERPFLTNRVHRTGWLRIL